MFHRSHHVSVAQRPRYRTLSQSQSRSRSYFTTGGLPSISSSWCNPLEAHDQRFFWTEPLLPYASCNMLSVERMGLSLMNRFRRSQVYVSHKFSLFNPSTDLTDNVSFIIAFARCRGNVSTELFPSNGCCTVACLHSCYLAMRLQVTILMDLSVS
jgi:hypothetical protein